MPSDVALSGASRRRLSASWSSNASASASEAPGGGVAGSREHPDISGKVIVDASVAIAWRRFIDDFSKSLLPLHHHHVLVATEQRNELKAHRHVLTYFLLHSPGPRGCQQLVLVSVLCFGSTFDIDNDFAPGEPASKNSSTC